MLRNQLMSLTLSSTFKNQNTANENFGIRKEFGFGKLTKIRHEDGRKERKRNGKIFLTPWALNRKE